MNLPTCFSTCPKKIVIFRSSKVTTMYIYFFTISWTCPHLPQLPTRSSFRRLYFVPCFVKACKKGGPGVYSPGKFSKLWPFHVQIWLENGILLASYANSIILGQNWTCPRGQVDLKMNLPTSKWTCFWQRASAHFAHWIISNSSVESLDGRLTYLSTLCTLTPRI